MAAVFPISVPTSHSKAAHSLRLAGVVGNISLRVAVLCIANVGEANGDVGVISIPPAFQFCTGVDVALFISVIVNAEGTNCIAPSGMPEGRGGAAAPLINN